MDREMTLVEMIEIREEGRCRSGEEGDIRRG